MKRVKNTRRTLCKQVISLYSNEISYLVKIRDVKKLQQDIEKDPIIKDQMFSFGCVLVRTIGNFFAPVIFLHLRWLTNAMTQTQFTDGLDSSVKW